MSSSPEAGEPLSAGRAALTDGRMEEAARWLLRASERYGDARAGQEARYLLAHVRLEQGRLSEALAAYQAFLARDRARAPARLVSVAEAQVERLLASARDWPALASLEALRPELRALPYPMRVKRLEAFIGEQSSKAAREAALGWIVQEAWEEGDWPRAVATLEHLGAGRPEASLGLKRQLRQARKEVRRTRIAWLAGGLLMSGALGLFAVRPWRSSQPRDLRWALVLLANWALLLWVLYGVYLVGRRPGDVAPVTFPRFTLLWAGSLLAFALGLGWCLALKRRLDGSALGVAALAIGTLLGGSALYLYSYLFDYVSVFGF